MAIPSNTAVMQHSGNILITEDIAMGIRAEDFPFLADVLNGLYSNTVAAPVREYSTNAWDSHVFAGVKRPIEVTLPSAENMEFIVQDFGLGMSIDDLRNTYAMYGASDKRDSNDVAGQLGLGSKSALSYADAFTVTGIKDGVKVTVMVTKNERGLGVIKPLDSRPTTEGNGVTIKIPVGRYDVQRFRDEAENLFRFWEPGTVLIDGKTPELQEWADSALHIDEDLILVRPDSSLYKSYVIMGNVPYPVPDATIKFKHTTIQRRFVARLNIGDVDFTPSREEVKHTAHTDNTIAELHAHIAERFGPSLERAKATCKTRWEETVLRSVWMGSRTNIGAAGGFIWTFDPNGYHRKAQAHKNYSVSNLTHTNLVVVTGFKAQTVSQSARERLVQFAGAATFVIFPTGAATHVLEGRPNTYAWSEIEGLTSLPKAAKAARGPKVETVYSIYGQNGMTAPQLAQVSGKVLYLNSNQAPRYGSLDATVVMLYSSNQLPRLQRYVPTIEHYEDEATRRREAATKAITPTDRQIALARTLPEIFKVMDHTKIDDTELANLILMAKMGDTDTMRDAQRFHVAIQPTGTLPDFIERYPLIGNGGYYNTSNKPLIAERTFYINAKHAARVAAESQQVAS